VAMLKVRYQEGNMILNEGAFMTSQRMFESSLAQSSPQMKELKLLTRPKLPHYFHEVA